MPCTFRLCEVRPGILATTLHFANMQIFCCILVWLMACWNLRRKLLTRLLHQIFHVIFKGGINRCVATGLVTKSIHPSRVSNPLGFVAQSLQPASADTSHLWGTILVCATRCLSFLKSSVLIQRRFAHSIARGRVEGNSSGHAVLLLPQTVPHPWQFQQMLFQPLLKTLYQTTPLLLCTHRTCNLISDIFPS